jgi:hypothetical protein
MIMEGNDVTMGSFGRNGCRTYRQFGLEHDRAGGVGCIRSGEGSRLYHTRRRIESKSGYEDEGGQWECFSVFKISHLRLSAHKCTLGCLTTRLVASEGVSCHRP